MESEQEILVSHEVRGKRLDLFLAQELGLPRHYVHRLLQKDRIRLEGRAAHKGAILAAGDRIRVRAFHHPNEGLRAATEAAPALLREENGLLAIDKPAGLPTHPLDYDETWTALNGLLARYPQIEGVGDGGLQSGVVHRLDIQTSGVLLFALDDAAWQRARHAFAERRVVKRYLARVHGGFEHECEVGLRLESRGSHVHVVEKGGREAWTRLRPLQRMGDSTLVEAYPSTGVMHQIRATLAHLGHPLLGDRHYGSTREMGRHLLHAERIRLGEIDVTSPVPACFYDA